MNVVILAAGRGSRMGGVTSNIPKALLPMGDETIISRLIRQVRKHTDDLITVVIGHGQEEMAAHLASLPFINIRTIYNEKYKDDINIWSLYLAIQEARASTLVIEGDIVASSDCIERVFLASESDDSIWFTKDKIVSPQYGGVLQTDENLQVVDIQLIKEFDLSYENFKKTIGILKIGSNEIETYIELMEKYSQESIKQYYMMPWIDNLAELNCKECDLAGLAITTFNELGEYQNSIAKFTSPK
ncbi:NTP transferase domain-containing protein [Gammaproteobacteria bacterium]|nr:NTP transferase domain-containing protein [Gammaproteobacteria bacterium]